MKKIIFNYNKDIKNRFNFNFKMSDLKLIFYKLEKKIYKFLLF